MVSFLRRLFGKSQQSASAHFFLKAIPHVVRDGERDGELADQMVAFVARDEATRDQLTDSRFLALNFHGFLLASEKLPENGMCLFCKGVEGLVDFLSSPDCLVLVPNPAFQVERNQAQEKEAGCEKCNEDIIPERGEEVAHAR